MRLGIAGAALLLAGCGAPPMQVAHVSAMSLAEANHLVAIACGEIAVAVARTDGKAKGTAIVDRCQAAHDRAHDALEVAAAAIDAWRAGQAGAPGCAVLDAQVAVLASVDVARGLGARVPPAVDDALSFGGGYAVQQLGGCERGR